MRARRLRASPTRATLLVSLLAAAGAGAAQGTVEPALPSRLAALQRELESGAEPTATLDRFWREVAEHGTPWVEPAPEGAGFSHVTFLWRGTAETRNVLISTLEQREIANADYLPKALMSRLSASDVWHKTYRLRSDARFTYQFSPNDPLTLLPELRMENWAARRAGFVIDPFNPKRFTTRNGECSVAELPDAPAQPWLEHLPGVPAGALEEQVFRSEILGNERVLTAYTPPGYEGSTALHPLLVFFDGRVYMTQVPAPVILDNLQARGKLPPVVAVFVDSGAARLLELSPNEPFQDFLSKELLPWIRERYRVSSRPEETTVVGLSLGATAAVFTGLRHPEVFGNVLSQSGGFEVPEVRRDTFAPRPPGELIEEDAPEHEWIARQFAEGPSTAVRFYLEVGLREEVGWKLPSTPLARPSAVLAHRHLRDVLRARGHEVHYREPNCGHEVLCWRGSLADGLIALLGERP